MLNSLYILKIEIVISGNLHHILYGFSANPIQSGGVYMEENKRISKQLDKDFSDKQAIKKDLSRQFDHELANEPLTAAERYNNKKTKKRQ